MSPCKTPHLLWHALWLTDRPSYPSVQWLEKTVVKYTTNLYSGCSLFFWFFNAGVCLSEFFLGGHETLAVHESPCAAYSPPAKLHVFCPDYQLRNPSSTPFLIEAPHLLPVRVACIISWRQYPITSRPSTCPAYFAQRSLHNPSPEASHVGLLYPDFPSTSAHLILYYITRTYIAVTPRYCFGAPLLYSRIYAIHCRAFPYLLALHDILSFPPLLSFIHRWVRYSPLHSRPLIPGAGRGSGSVP
jgi:hypothetical protein